MKTQNMKAFDVPTPEELIQKIRKDWALVVLVKLKRN
jgi:hypothetical protein